MDVDDNGKFSLERVQNEYFVSTRNQYPDSIFNGLDVMKRLFIIMAQIYRGGSKVDFVNIKRNDYSYFSEFTAWIADLQSNI